jgi:hypothetical protein
MTHKEEISKLKNKLKKKNAECRSLKREKGLIKRAYIKDKEILRSEADELQKLLISKDQELLSEKAKKDYFESRDSNKSNLITEYHEMNEQKGEEINSLERGIIGLVKKLN